jgi:hypothetical protein
MLGNRLKAQAYSTQVPEFFCGPPFFFRYSHTTHTTHTLQGEAGESQEEGQAEEEKA